MGIVKVQASNVVYWLSEVGSAYVANASVHSKITRENEKLKGAGAAEGLLARVLSKKTSPSCTSQVLPQTEGGGHLHGKWASGCGSTPRVNGTLP